MQSFVAGAGRAAPAGPRIGPPSSRWVRWLAVGSIAALLALIVVIQYMPRGGPAVADSLRSVLGDRSVTWLEERWAALQDLWMRLSHLRAPPRRLGDASPALAPLPPVATEASPPEGSALVPATTPATAEERAFAPPELVPPPFAEVAAVDDGVWYPIFDPARPDAAAFGYRTLIHPDPERTFAELFIVALPTRQIQLHAVAGTLEPESSNPDAQRLEPRGLIAPEHEPVLLAAFNGGFKARHGHHGMLVGGVELLPLQAGLCTIISNESGVLRIATWRRSDVLEAGAWYRQTPACMLERGVLHPGLQNPESRKWGATIEGETVIRRSALGLDRQGDVVYMGVSNATTARALALGMQSAGAWSVAQLDVNWSYPRFLLFPKDAFGVRHAQSLFKGFLFEPEEMLREPSPRDFFYVTRRGSGDD